MNSSHSTISRAMTRVAFSGLAFCLSAALASAGTFSINPFVGDADSGISTANRYVQKVDFATGSNNVINGVQFLGFPAAGPNFSVNVTDTFNNFDSPVANDQAIEGLFRDFFYRGDAGAETLSISGLQPGVSYTVSLFAAGFNSNTVSLSANDTTPATTTAPFDRGTASGGQRLDYAFSLPVGQSSINMTFTPVSVPLGSFHQYGFTVQESAYTLPAGYVSISGLANTGVTNLNAANGSNGSQIAATGVTDTHWQVMAPGAGSFANALTATNQGAYFNGGVDASFINASGSAAQNDAAGTYTYRTTFSVPNNVNLNSIILSGRAIVDNDITDVLINGHSTGFTSTAFNEAAFTAFVLDNDFFLSGLNTLDFIVSNAGPDANPTAVRIEGLRAIAQVPEPSTFAMLAIAVLVIIAFRKM